MDTENISRLNSLTREELENLYLKKEQQYLSEKESLQEKNQSLVNLIENVSYGSFIYRTKKDGTSHFEYLNKRCIEITGVDPELVLLDGKNLFQYILPEDYDNFLEKSKESILEKKTILWKGRLLKNEKTRWIQVESFPNFQTNGDVLWNGFIYDITERKKIEESVKINDSQLNFANTVETILLVLDRDGIVTTINKQGCAILGYPEEEILGEFWFQKFLPKPDEMEKIYPLFLEFMSSGKEIQMEYFENQIVNSSGEIRLIAWHNIVLRDEKKNIIGILCSGEDITNRKKIEEEIVKAKNFSESIIASLPGIFYVIDQNGKFLRVNNQFLNITGYTEEEVDLMHPLDFFTNSEKQLLTERIQEVFEKGKSNVEANMLLKNGNTIPYFFTGYRAVIDNLPLLIGVGVDISERKKAEDELQKSEKKFRRLFEKSTDALTIVENETFIDCNQSTVDLLGFNTKEEIISLHPSQVSPKFQPDGELSSEKAQKMMRLTFQKGAHRFEWVHKRKNGETVYTEVLLTSISEDPNKRQLYTVWRDITDRKKAEESLAEERERLLVTLKSIGDGVITTDVSGNIILMNSVAEELCGWSLEEAKGKPLPEIFRIIHEFTREVFESPVSRVLKTGSIVELENHTVLISRNGTERVIADSGSPIRNQKSEIIGVVLVFRDMTEKHKMQTTIQRSAKLDSLGVLAGGIAHDFNNLLSGIYGNIDLALENSNDKRNIAYLNKAIGTIDRAKGLTSQLLTFAKGGSPAREITQIVPFLKKTILFALSGSNVSCLFQIEEGLWNCNIDKHQIAQVFDNIVINAKQAMPFGGKIEVIAENIKIAEKKGNLEIELGEYVKISIKDYGHGMSKKTLSKIFDPYYTTKEGGHGLGLATCYSIINKHEGSIDVESEVGVGSIFHIYLPAEKSIKSEKKLQDDESKPDAGVILILEDEDTLGEIMTYMIGSLGYTVICKKDGQEIIDYFQNDLNRDRKIKGMILDITIPGGMGGKEVIPVIRKLDQIIPVFIISGYTEDMVMTNPWGYGFTASISKPFTKRELSDILSKYVR
ncbi:MAG: PAS domain S-box protein [Leptospiraceae bacterium]|nr:PAS domain S-box protein [Leptospiraceae bacterium]MCK6380354.1 PAS domain S-box protein [Leptospiraceae bacterium]